MVVAANLCADNPRVPWFTSHAHLQTVCPVLLLLAVVFHASLGLRIILLDFGLVSVRYQKALIGGLAALGAFMFIIVWVSIY